jgi:hypothetical protein
VPPAVASDAIVGQSTTRDDSDHAHGVVEPVRRRSSEQSDSECRGEESGIAAGLPECAVAAMQNSPDGHEGGNYEEQPGHENGPRAKAAKEGGAHCRRQDGTCSNSHEHDEDDHHRGRPRRIGHVEKLA